MNELRKASCEDASSLHNSFCSPFSLAELSTAICNLSFSTASGPDQIAYPLLKHLPEPACLLLLSVLGRSWHSHTFPSCWRPTTIIPIHTPRKPTSSQSSFRPVSLTSGISELFERLILSRLTFHLGSNRLLSACQSGFHPRFLLCPNQSGAAFKGRGLRAEPFWHLLTSPRLSAWSGALLCFAGSPLASFFECALSFLIMELGYRLVVPTAATSASDVGSPRARFLVQSSSFCLLMTSLRIYLGVPMPPCMLTIWPSDPPPQTRSKPLVLSGPPSLS